MIPNAVDRNMKSEGISAEGTFGISVDDTAHIMSILRDTLYTDRVLAVLREYASNAWDANREAGMGDVPIRIHIPTAENPTLTIRDNGPGLSEDDVFTIYTQYGASTKRSSDLAVGMLGIGSKAAFAYSDTFMVSSWHGGMKRVYVAALDDSDMGVMQRLHEEPCEKDETGVEIKIAVRPEDISEFTDKGCNLYSHFVPQPAINIALRPPREADAVLENGTIYEREGEWVALMGCVPYRININQISDFEEAEGLWLPVSKLSGVLNFDIGEVEISASREELKYTKKTKTILIDRFESLIEEYVQHSLSVIKSNSITPWAKRLRMSGLQRMGLPFPDSSEHWTTTRVPIFHNDGKEQILFTVVRDKNQVSNIPVYQNVRLVVKNDPRKIKGFRLIGGDYVINPIKGASLTKVREQLDRFLKAADLTGIEIIDISTIPFCEPVSRYARRTNKKHLVKTFRLVGCSTSGSRSDNWEIVTREPTDDDVFVIINRFEVEDFPNFYDTHKTDMEIASVLGAEMPEVYGYKSTAKKPISREDCKGISYDRWRKPFLRSHITPRIRRAMYHYLWSTLFNRRMWDDKWCRTYPGKTKWDRASKVMDHLDDILGRSHPIPRMFRRHVRSSKKLDKCSVAFQDALPILIHYFVDRETASATKTLDDINSRYPLLVRHASFSALWEPDNYYRENKTYDEANEWADYVRMVDMAQLTKSNTGVVRKNGN